MEGHSQANPPSPANATGEANRVAPRRSNADRHKDDARPDMEPLNDTTGRTKRVFRKTPPPPINRHSTSKIGAAPPPQDDFRGSACLNRFEEPLNDTTGLTKRVLRKTPPPSKMLSSADVCG
ncbi:hypothetical protein T484DRAFT_1821208 [Baffinella frigidus]|nr:hypothetical protein T484DRAFT_1821208 [Cryptophyta sp. CCMP2293]